MENLGLDWEDSLLLLVALTATRGDLTMQRDRVAGKCNNMRHLTTTVMVTVGGGAYSKVLLCFQFTFSATCLTVVDTLKLGASNKSEEMLVTTRPRRMKPENPYHETRRMVFVAK